MEYIKKLLDFGEEVSNTAPMSERLVMGLQTTLLGMGVVFLVLIILWAVLGIFSLVFTKSSTEKKAEAPASAPVAAPVPEIVPSYSESDDAELVAVITAAIASMMDAPQTSFRVVSFRRTASK